VPAKGSDVDPNVETCESNTVDEERQYRTFINVMDGARPSIQIVDANSDGAFNSADNGVSRKRVRKGSHRLISKNKTTMLDVDVKNDKENLARMPERSLRPSWRQMK
jgi:type IV pilus assembly protein PilY1